MFQFLVRLSSNSVNQVLAKAQPIQGSAALFRDSLWHDGEELLGGVKWLLRTDVMYERVVPIDFEALYKSLSEEGKAERANFSYVVL